MVSGAETDTPTSRDLYLGDLTAQVLSTAKGLVLVGGLNRLAVRQDPNPSSSHTIDKDGLCASG